MGLEDFDGVFLGNVSLGEVLIIVKVDEVCHSVILTSLATLRAVPSEVSYFSALKTCVQRVSHGGRIALEVVLRAVPLVSIGVLSSAEVISLVVSSVVPLGWCPVPIYVHWDWGVVHPAGSIR